jgi:predicted amidophosphoribosyltransferase
MVAVLSRHRPIPDLGLVCPKCEYSLTGLTGNHCPECGSTFSLMNLLSGETADRSRVVMHDGILDPPDHGIARREPYLTGRERPLPELGLLCNKCGNDLLGAGADTCPICGEPFRLGSIMRGAEWVDVARWFSADFVASVGSLLNKAEVPYIVPANSARLSKSAVPQWLVPRKFLSEALNFLAAWSPLIMPVPEGEDSLKAGTEWIDVTQWISKDLAISVRSLLYKAQVPYLVSVNSARIADPNAPQLLVPREFLFDALTVFAAWSPPAAPPTEGEDWACPTCKETVPGNFEVCWNCQTPREEQDS